MKIKIYDDAVGRYASKFKGQQIPNKEWCKTLSLIQGQTLEVNTNILFADSFNTKPAPDLGINYMLGIGKESVEEVIDDERIGKAKCGYCGYSHNLVGDKSLLELHETKCFDCEKSGYLKKYLKG